MEQTTPWRYRLNVSTSVKGVQTADATIEFAGDALDYQDFLVIAKGYHDAVNALYPPPLDVK